MTGLGVETYSEFRPGTATQVGLAERRFRANPGYALSTREDGISRPFADHMNSPIVESVYGRLLPRTPACLTTRPVSPDAALLFLSLQIEGPLPAHFRALWGRRTENILTRLVLDGVLEVEHEGEFVAGRTAWLCLFGADLETPKGRIAELSIQALQYADALADLSVPELTRRIYDFGRLPVCMAQESAHQEAEAIESLVKTADPFLNRYWVRTPIADATWIMWRPLMFTEDQELSRFKLYVSPSPEDAGLALQASTEVLGQSSGVRGLKIGRGTIGLTRPDKIVAYFSRFDDLQEAGFRLRQRLQGCAPHGVPFTAELSRDGLLSWGADPPQVAGPGPRSWRLWIAAKLATYFETEKRLHTTGPIWHLARERLRLDGVDTDAWMVHRELWVSGTT